MADESNALTLQRKQPPAGLFPGLKPSKLISLIRYLAFFVSANAMSSVLVTLARLCSGGCVILPKNEQRRRPEKRLQLFEWQGT
jgi:hypothetical protein